MPRIVSTEILDGLAADDPQAMRARSDLRRVHRAMGTRSIVQRALRAMLPAFAAGTPMRVLELGAGDGTLMLGVARALGAAWPPTELILIDRQELVASATIEAYAEVRWKATARVLDVFAWIDGAQAWNPPGAPGARWDLIVTNLFLHHFDGAALAGLVDAMAARTERFLACEPRRSWLALGASHLVGALGISAVTCKDAVASVHAGFCGRELTAVWPAQSGGWQVRESAAGLFSHCFCAMRSGAS